MPKTRSGRSTENTDLNQQSQGASIPSPPISLSEGATFPAPPQSTPEQTSLHTSYTISQQAPPPVNPPSTPLSFPLRSGMDTVLDSSEKFLTGTLVQLLQQITQTFQEHRPVIWYNELRQANAPTFIGAPDPLAAEKWVKDMEKLYWVMEVPQDKWVNLAVSFLSGNAEMWYETIEAVYGQIHDWTTFKDHFYKNYFPMSARNQKITDFFKLKQGHKTVLEYAHKFFELGKFVPDIMGDELRKIGKFEEGFNYMIKDGLCGQRVNDFSDLLEKAIRVENLNNITARVSGVKRTLDEADQTETIITALVNTNKKSTAVTTHVHPMCQKCRTHHSGDCRACFQCGQIDHIRKHCPDLQTQTSVPTIASRVARRKSKRECTDQMFTLDAEPVEVDETNATGDRRVGSSGLCFQCGQMGHFARDCHNRQTRTRVQSLQTTSQDTPSISKRTCSDRMFTLDADPVEELIEVDETNATDGFSG